MREDIYELIRFASSLGLITVLGTNGTLITLSVAEKLLDAGLQHCAVSIDGATPQTHELHDIIRLADSLSADALQLFFYVRAGRCSQDVAPPSLNEDAFESIQGKTDLRIIGTTRYKGSKCCTAADRVCCILNDGTVYPCMLLPVPLGNVMQNTLSDIWNNSPLIMKIDESKKGKFAGKELCRVWK